ncbi:cullin-associated NEDD8-dissociated protein 1-like [Sycon ciliatum]|uniref:cullin-associated NEDD8-dissociated protein 1-like n=1 Tax=Sycon ciliatum TaxID=27933 RepID=UPI0031F67FD6
MAMSATKISQWVEKMSSIDKDFRFMAVNDLLGVLKKGYVIDEELETTVVCKLLDLLKDKSPEVQNLAMQCFGPMLEKAGPKAMTFITKSLCERLAKGDDTLKDVAALTLKAIVKEPPKNDVHSESTRLLHREIADGVCRVLKTESQGNVQLSLDCLDILQVQLQFAMTMRGSIVSTMENNIWEAIHPALFNESAAVRKRATVALSYFMVTCTDGLNLIIVSKILANLDEATSAQDNATARSLIQTFAAISTQAGHRLSEHLAAVFKHLYVHSEGSGDEENVDFVLQTFEAFIRRCPKEVAQYLPEITSRCLRFLSHDPNYNYGDEAMDEDEDVEDSEDDDDEEDADYSDDEDVSWKVRRGSAKCLMALITSRRDLTAEFYRTISPVLISRFKEREENVKVDIFAAYEALLSSTKAVSSTSVDSSDASVACLREQSPVLVKAVHRQMKEKSSRVRLACFSLLSKLVGVLPGVLSPYVSMIIPATHACLVNSKQTSSIKTDTLVFLKHLLQTHPPEDFRDDIIILVPSVTAAIEDTFYKTISEALLVAAAIFRVVRPLETAISPVSSEVDQQVVVPLYGAIMGRLVATDIDQEVKENALITMAHLISHFADHLGGTLNNCLNVYTTRLGNEVTRIAAIKSLAIISESPLATALPDAGKIVELMTSFLKKKQRSLVISTLAAANPILTTYHSELPAELLAPMMLNCFALVNSADLHLSQLALVVMTNIARLRIEVFKWFQPDHMAVCVSFPQSPLVQGGVLHSFADFLKSVPQHLGDEILAKLQKFIYTDDKKKPVLPMHRQCYVSFAFCSAALVSGAGSCPAEVAHSLLSIIQNAKASNSAKFYALLTLGEIGKNRSLGLVNEGPILDCFSDASEDVKTAASVCLGLISSGNPTHFVPIILSEIGSKSRHQYLLLHALRELITTLSSDEADIQLLQPCSDAIWELLFTHCESIEEGTRNMVAECLGKLTLIDPFKRLPILQAGLSSPSTAVARATVISAVRFTISDKVKRVDELLKDSIRDFLSMLEDPDLNVRRVTLLLLNSVAHNKPSLIIDRLPTILPALYQETNIRKELIREVEMGPFKHSVDDGLDIRKAAFECMYTLLESCLEKLDIFEFLSHVEGGMKDHYDIKMLTYLMIIRLALIAPLAVFQRLGSLMASLKTIIVSKSKANAVKQELEKQEELKRSAMRCAVELLQLPESDKNPTVSDFLSTVKASNDLSEMLRSLHKKPGNGSMATGSVAAPTAAPGSQLRRRLAA